MKTRRIDSEEMGIDDDWKERDDFLAALSAVERLRAGRTMGRYQHCCPDCDEECGSASYTSQGWWWSSSVSHCVREHRRRPDPDFVQAILSAVKGRPRRSLSFAKCIFRRTKDSDQEVGVAVMLPDDLGVSAIVAADGSALRRSSLYDFRIVDTRITVEGSAVTLDLDV